MNYEIFSLDTQLLWEKKLQISVTIEISQNIVTFKMKLNGNIY